jgi:branched-chain amino acid aminotransferase
MDNNSPYIWKNWEIIDWDNALDHNLTHTLHYGSWVFEGIRFYDTDNGPKIFRLHEHIDRLFYSASIFEMEFKYSKEDIKNACLELVEKSGISEWYIRPIIYYGYGKMWVNPTWVKVDCVVSLWGWGSYLWEEPVRVKIPSIKRIDPRTADMSAKVCGNYANAILASLEIKKWWFDEWLLLDTSGFIAEWPGENVFFVWDDERIYTPELGTILPGITRVTVIELFQDKFGISVMEQKISPSRLGEFKEAFFVWTAAEVSLIASITDEKWHEFCFSSDNEESISRKMKKIYLDVVKGRDKDYSKYLS